MRRYFAGWRLRLTRPTGSSRKLNLTGPASAVPPGNLSAPYPPLCRVAATPYPAYRILSQAYTSQARQALRRCAIYRRRTCHYAGWRLRLTRPTYVRPAVNLFTIVAETADAGGLKIAETFPEGRGSPHGCGLRAVFCRDAASARPEACRDKSKGPRSGDFAGRSPGVQGAAATGRPLCAPCAIRDITQKINRERNLPEINIDVVALPNIVRTGTFPVVPLFRRVAAAPYPAYNNCRAIRLGRRLNPARRRCRQTPAAPDASWHWPPAVRNTAQSA